jgi:hypothetical protein
MHHDMATSPSEASTLVSSISDANVELMVLPSAAACSLSISLGAVGSSIDTES